MGVDKHSSPSVGHVFVNNSKSLTVFNDAFNNPNSFPDFTIKFNSGTTIRVHKLILAAQSEFFSNLFSQGATEFTVDANENEKLLTLLLHLLYTTELEVPQEQIARLHELAAKYKLSAIVESLNEQKSESDVNHVSGSQVWWRQKREKLLQLMVQQSPPKPLYVYDEEHLRNRAKTFLDIFAGGLNATVFFAIKANSYPQILQIFEGLGIGFECVSTSMFDISLL
jgi:hypothetical protein